MTNKASSNGRGDVEPARQHLGQAAGVGSGGCAVTSEKDSRSLGIRTRSQGSRLRGRGPLNDAGMATAEYAVATLAACGFAGLLLVLLTGGEVRGMLLAIVKRALTLD